MNIPSLRVWIIALLLLSLSVAAGQPLATAAPARTATLEQLVGSWAVDATTVKQDIQFPALITFTSDGIVLADEPPMPFETTGHGVWVATGADSADFTFVALVGSESGALSGKIKVTGSLTMDAAADTWAGPFKIQIVDADGAEVMADEGTFAGTRIGVETVETAVPAALMPGDKIGEMTVAQGPDPFDFNVAPIPAFCNTNPFFEPGNAVATPGEYTVECTMPPLPELLVGFGWVAINAERRDIEWAALDTELYINDLAVDQAAFGSLDADVPVTGVPGLEASEVVTQALRTWNVLLQDLQSGPLTLRWVFHVSQELDDGVVVVPAGTYDITFKVTVDEALTEEQGAPEPVVLLQPDALMPGDKIGDLELAKGPDPFDPNVPPYAAFCNASPELAADSNVAKPGVYTVACSMPPVPELLVGFGWVTDNQELLEKHWAAVETELYVNGQPVDQTAFGQLDGSLPVSGIPGEDPNKVIEMPLRLWNVVLKDLQTGEFELRYVRRVDQELVDSTMTVPAGVYDITYHITVDPALAASEGEPAPVEMVRSPVEYVGKIDTSAQKIQNPTGLAVDGQGNVYLTDGSDTPRVVKYDKDGNFVTEWGSRGSGEGQFEFIPANPEDGPTAGFVAADKDGNVYVSDAYNGRIQKFDPDGNFLGQFGSMGTGDGQFDPPTAGPIYVDSQNNLYVSTFPRVQKFDADGNFLAAYGSAGTGNGEFSGAALGTIDEEGAMYVADLLNVRVQKLDADGNYVLQWGSAGTEPGQFFMPVSIVQDSNGKLYVADGTGRIQVFTTDGEYQGEWSETGDGNPPLGGEISGLVIDDQDNIYVADFDTPSIYIFRPQ